MSNKDKNKYHHYKRIKLDSSLIVPKCQANCSNGGLQFLNDLRSLTLFLSEGELETKYKKTSLMQLVEIICGENYDKLPSSDKEDLLQEIVNKFSRKLSMPSVMVELRTNQQEQDEVNAEMFTEHDGQEHFNNKKIVVYESQKYGLKIENIDEDGNKKEIFIKSKNGPATLFALLHEIKHIHQTYRMHNLFNGAEVERLEALMGLQGSLSYAREIDTEKDFTSKYILNPLEIDANLFAYKMMKKLDTKANLDLDFNTQFNFIATMMHILVAYGYKTDGVESLVGRRILTKDFNDNIEFLETLDTKKTLDREGFRNVSVEKIVDFVKNKVDVKAYLKSLEKQFEEVFNDIIAVQREFATISQFSNIAVKKTLLKQTEIVPEFMLSFATINSENDSLEEPSL